MRRVGEVDRIAQGVAIVRCSEATHPDIGAMVVDERLDTVGRVVDVFGPVDRPYLAVTPSGAATLPSLLGKKLYTR